MKKFIEKKIMLQDREAYEAVKKLCMDKNTPGAVFLFGDDSEGITFLTDLFRKNVDIVLSPGDDTPSIEEFCIAKTYFFEDTQDEMPEIASIFKDDRILVRRTHKPEDQSLTGNEEIYEIKPINHLSKLNVIEEIAKDLNLRFDPLIAKDIAVKSNTIEELYRAVLARLSPAETEKKSRTKDLRSAGKHIDRSLPVFILAAVAMLLTKVLKKKRTRFFDKQA